MKRFRLFTYVAILFAVGTSIQAQGVLDVTRKKITAEDLRAALGLDVYSFLLSLPEGEAFTIAVLTVSEDGTETLRRVGLPFARVPGEPPALRLVLMPRPGPPGQALLSQAPELSVSVSITGSDGAGFATIINNPTATIPGTEKMVASSASRVGNRIHLVEILKKADDPRKRQLAAAIVIAPIDE